MRPEVFLFITRILGILLALMRLAGCTRIISGHCGVFVNECQPLEEFVLDVEGIWEESLQRNNQKSFIHFQN